MEIPPGSPAACSAGRTARGLPYPTSEPRGQIFRNGTESRVRSLPSRRRSRNGAAGGPQERKPLTGFPPISTCLRRAAAAVSQRKRLSCWPEKIPSSPKGARRFGSRLIPLTLGLPLDLDAPAVAARVCYVKQTTHPPTACCKEWVSQDTLHSPKNSHVLICSRLYS